VNDGKKMAHAEVDGQQVKGQKRPARAQMRSMPVQPVVLLTGPRLSFVRELRGNFHVREVDAWETLAEVLPSQHPASVVVLDPYGGGDIPCREFWEVIERFPSVSVVAAFEANDNRTDQMAGMVLAGVSEFLNLAREDTGQLAAARIRSAFARPFKRRVGLALSRHVSVEARTIVTAAAEIAVRGQGPKELAEVFSVRAKTLTSWCAAHSVPLPRRLLGWLRILLAAHLLEDVSRTRAGVAAACGYRTDRSLRRIIQRFIGSRPAGPLFEAAAAAFNAELRACREAVRSSCGNRGLVANPMQDGDVQSYPATPGRA
jgi:AraC-like DNA-binding protein